MQHLRHIDSTYEHNLRQPHNKIDIKIKNFILFVPLKPGLIETLFCKQETKKKKKQKPGFFAEKYN